MTKANFRSVLNRASIVPSTRAGARPAGRTHCFSYSPVLLPPRHTPRALFASQTLIHRLAGRCKLHVKGGFELRRAVRGYVCSHQGYSRSNSKATPRILSATVNVARRRVKAEFLPWRAMNRQINQGRSQKTPAQLPLRLHLGRNCPSATMFAAAGRACAAQQAQKKHGEARKPLRAKPPD
jgi:hypothetical protein